MAENESEATVKDLLTALEDTGNGTNEFIPTTDVELTHEIVQTLFDPTNLNMITSISKKELSGVVKIYLLNELIHENRPSILTRLMTNFLTLKVSENRQGRSELIKAIIGRQEQNTDGKGFISKYLH